MLEFFIAKRYLKSKHKINFITVISIISIIGIIIGVAALVITMSVLNGFRSIVVQELVSIDPHIKIFAKNKAGIEDLNKVRKTLIGFDEVKKIVPFIEGKVITIYGNEQTVLDVRGVSEEIMNNWKIKNKIVEGGWNIFDDGKTVILGVHVANKLACIENSEV